MDGTSLALGAGGDQGHYRCYVATPRQRCSDHQRGARDISPNPFPGEKLLTAPTAIQRDRRSCNVACDLAPHATEQKRGSLAKADAF